MLKRSAEPDEAVAPPGSIKPRVSVRQAMVEAVPMTMQVPPVGQRDCPSSSSSLSSNSPERNLNQNLRQSVHAPSRSPCQSPVRMGPVTTETAGRLTEAAAIN